MSGLITESIKGNYDEAKEIHYKMLDLTNALFAEGNPAGVKAALKFQKVISSDNLRLPLVPVTEILRTEIESYL